MIDQLINALPLTIIIMVAIHFIVDNASSRAQIKDLENKVNELSKGDTK